MNGIERYGRDNLASLTWTYQRVDWIIRFMQQPIRTLHRLWYNNQIRSAADYVHEAWFIAMLEEMHNLDDYFDLLYSLYIEYEAQVAVNDWSE